MPREHPKAAIATTILVSILLHVAHAQDAIVPIPEDVTSAPDAVNPPAAELSLSEIQQVVRDERQALERQAERQTEAIASIAQAGAWMLSLVLAAVVGLFFWMFGTTRRELRNSIREIAKAQLHDIVDSQAEIVRSHVRRIEEELRSLRGTRSSITWVVAREQDANTALVAQLQSRNIDVNAVVPQAGQPFEIGEPELVIVSYDPTENGTGRLGEVVDKLKERAPPVPIVVYTFDPSRGTNRLLPAHETLLAAYTWYVPANFPLQLVAHVTSLLSPHRPIAEHRT